MPSLFSTSAALLAGVSMVAAAPSHPQGTFRVNQVHSGYTHKSHSAYHAQRAYHKYGQQAPAVIQKAAAAAADQTGSATANPEKYDRSYLVPVQVGGQTLNLDFDTGSSDLWVFSDETPSSESAGHNKYDTSSGKKLEGSTWSIGYLDGSGSSGDVYADKVVVGGVTATSQAVEAATSVSGQFTNDTQNDGLLGLAFSSKNTVKPKKQTTFFDTVKSTLAKELFTADLKHDEPGSYDFGYIDSKKYTGDITYLDVDSSTGFWTVTTDDGYSTVVDTGTSVILAPQDVADAYYNNVDSAQYTEGAYILDCDANPDDWTVGLGGTTFSVSGKYLVYGGDLADAGFPGKCLGGIQPSSKGQNILGDVFLKSVFAIFDVSSGSAQVGLAAKP